MTNIENKWEAIRSINPNAVTMSGDKIFNNDGNEIFINETDITNKIAELKTAYDKLEYQRKRAAAYPTIQEQLDMQYWDKVNDTTTWKDAVAKVKSDNPKN